MLTPFHAKYYALDLSRRGLVGEVDAVGTALFDAQVDLNPHQIEAALVGMQRRHDSHRSRPWSSCMVIVAIIPSREYHASASGLHGFDRLLRGGSVPSSRRSW